MWAVFFYGFRRGGWAEKVAISSIIINAYVSALTISAEDSMYRQVEVRMLMADIALLLALMIIAFTSRKFWPLWLVAFQGITIMAHFAPRLHLMPAIYYNAVSLWSYPMLFVLAVAIRNHGRFSSGSAHLSKGRATG